MKKLMLLVLLMVTTAGYPQTGSFAIFDDGVQTATKTVSLADPKDINTDDIVDGAVTPVKTTNIYSKMEVDEALGGLAADLAQGQRIYYCSSGTEVVGGVTYGVLSQSLDPAETTVTIGPLVGATYAQYTPGRGRISPPAGLGVTSIPAGNYERVSFMTNSMTNNKSATIQYRLWHVDAAGTKIAQIATSTEGTIAPLGATVIQRIAVSYPIASVVTVAATDRIIEDFWFKRSGDTGGGGPTLIRYVGGTHAGFFSLAVPSGVVMLTDGSNASGGIIRSIVTGTLAATTDTILVPLADIKINTTAPKFILTIGGIQYIYPQSHDFVGVSDDGTNLIITLSETFSTNLKWSLLTLSDNL